MQRKDVERLADSLDTFAQHYPGLAKDAANALRTLLAERDAAFAAGQESMREWAASANEKRGTVYGRDAAAVIRDLPIKSRP